MERGIKTTEELQQLVQDYQSGTPEVEQPDLKQSAPQYPSYYDIANRNVATGVANTYTREALSQGYGTSRFDKEFYAGEDIETRRAIAQSDFGKITNYLGKGAVTAATTFANGTAGLALGLVNSAIEAVADPDNNGRHPLDALVNNPFSDYMERLRDWSDKAIPTYLTAEQRTEEYQREWYKHILTTDFAGEFIQNFGFTVGALLSGAAWAKGLSVLKTKGFADNILKGAIVASEGDAAATQGLTRAYEALKAGRITRVDANKLTQNVKDIAKQINRANTDVQLFGAMVGAMSEGDMEGIMARNEMLADFNNKLTEEHDTKYNQALDDVLSSNDPLLTTRSSEFNPETGEYLPMLTEAGKAEVLKRQREITDNERKQLEIATREGERIASITFALNLPVLTASNMVQFGRMLSGGWKTSRKLLGVQGGVQIGKDAITAAYAPKGSIATKTVLKSLENILTEGSEEMIQGYISSGNQKYAMEKIASFNNDAYDEKSINAVRDWLSNFNAGGLEYLKDIKNWKEGALGGLTGLFGIPGRRWNGGVLGARSEAKEEVDASRRAAEEMNRRVNDPEFRLRWNGYIRHMKYDDAMAQAAAADDEYAWHTEDDKQLISDVVMFADADRLDDLVDIANSFKTVSAEDIESLKQNLDWAKGQSNETIISKISDQADRMVNTVNEYREMYDALSSRAPINASKEFLKEMTVTAQYIKAYEKRFAEMLADVTKMAEPLLVDYAKVTEEGEKNVTEQQQKQRLTELKEYFASVLETIPVKYISDDIIEEIDKDLTTLMTSAQWDDATKQKIRDMRKAINDRQMFYRKLQFLQGDAKNQETGKKIPQEDAEKAFEKASMTPEKVEQAAEKQNAIDETKDLRSVDDVRQAYIKKKAKDRIEFFENLRRASKKNDAIKTFVDMKEFVDGFRGYVERNAFDVDFPARNQDLSRAVNSLLDYAESVDDIKELSDDMFESYDSYANSHSSVFKTLRSGNYDQARYEEIKTIFRDAMKNYLGLKSDTQATPKAKPMDTGATPEILTEGGGYDAAPPASATGSPAMSEEERKENKEKPQETQPEIPEITEPTPQEVETFSLESQRPENPMLEQSIDDDSIEDNKGNYKYVYWRTSVPEISTEQARKARIAINSRMTKDYKDADLSDFVIKNPEYKEIWNALNDRGAFEYVATQLKQNDEIEFIIDPTFPTYNNETQILLATKIGDEHQVLSALTYKTSDYYGVKEFRKRMLDEYEKFKQTNPNDIYVFPETSKAFWIRTGLMEYDYSKDGNKPIQNIPSYSEDAPIVSINYIEPNVDEGETDGRFEINAVRGGKNAEEVAGKIIVPKMKNRTGLYYLVKNNASENGYIPVALTTERFNKENYDTENPTFERIREAIRNLADKLANVDGTNYEEKMKSIRANELEKLTHLLDIHRAWFDLRSDPQYGVSLVLKPVGLDETKEKKVRNAGWYFNIQYADNNQIYNWLVDKLAKMNRHVQIDGTTSAEQLKEMVDNNVITSNAARLRMKGVDFYCDPWSEEDGKFKRVLKPSIDNEVQDKAKSEKELLDTSKNDNLSLMKGEEEIQPKVKEEKQDDSAVPVARTTEEFNDALNEGGALDFQKLSKLNFEELPDGIQHGLTSKGYGSEEYNQLNDDERESILVCFEVS